MMNQTISAISNVTINLTTESSLNDVLQSLGNLTKKDKFKEVRRCYHLHNLAKEKAEESEVEDVAENDTDAVEDSEFIFRAEDTDTYKDISDEELERIMDAENLSKEHWPVPTVKTLRENVNPLVSSEDSTIVVYRNGFAVYTNFVGKMSVVWVPDCVDFVASYVERDKDMRAEESGQDFAKRQPWITAVLLLGDVRCELNRSNSKGDRGKAEYDDNRGAKAGRVERSEDDERVSREDTISAGASCFDSPERAYEKKETFIKLMKRLTPCQRDVALGYYIYGFNHEEMGKCLGISKGSVQSRMNLANDKLGDAGIKFLEYAPNIDQYCPMFMDMEFLDRLMEMAGNTNGKQRVSYRVVGRKNK